MFKDLYNVFLSHHQEKQFYTCHSHHFWPDVTKKAVLDYWEDTAKHVDDKWSHIFANKLPQAQSLIAEVLNISNPRRFAFASNTHELLYRILSCFESNKKIKILTTDSEFYSFKRQINRLKEEDLIEVVEVPVNPITTFSDRFIKELESQTFSLVFVSHIFFNSGIVFPELEKVVEATPSETQFVLDAYHSFMAVPFDFSKFEKKVFYLAGAYKYAQGGEGCCFLYVPDSAMTLRPRYTGWFASFETLENFNDNVEYSDSGFRFAGSTMDYTALYRLNSVLSLFNEKQISVAKIHEHIQNLQTEFLKQLKRIDNKELNENKLIINDLKHHGHFLTFELDSVKKVKDLMEFLKENNIHTDSRGKKIRFGFGMQMNKEDIDLSCLQNFK